VHAEQVILALDYAPNEPTTNWREIMTIGVTGASGHLGRAVSEGLLEQVETNEVRLITRDPSRLDDLRARGVEVRRGDFDEPTTLEAAFASLDRLLLISTDALGARVAGQEAAIEAAARAGVEHVVYTSVGNPSDDNPAVVAPEHRATEDALRSSGLRWTFLRNGIYSDLLLGSAPAAVASGTLIANSAAGRSGYVTRADCAAVAVAVLTGDGHAETAYDITGPEALDAHDVAAIYSELSGRRIEVALLDDEAWIAAMVEHAGMPEPVAAAYASFGAAQREGYSAVVTDRVELLTGRAPQSLRDFLALNRDALVVA
jgi:NAD(P)H dehydrogenase (quinone)